MVLNVRQKQAGAVPRATGLHSQGRIDRLWPSSPECQPGRAADGVVRMLHFNAPPAGGARADEEVYKVLVLDAETKSVLAPLLHVNVSGRGWKGRTVAAAARQRLLVAAAPLLAERCGAVACSTAA